MTAEHPRPAGGPSFPLTAQQRRAWAWSQGRSRWRCSVVLDGPIDVDALRMAVSRATASHEILRARLVDRRGLALPVQVIEAPHVERLRVEDLRALDEPAQEARLQAIGCELDAVADRPLGCALARLGAERHTLELTVQATHADARSLILFVEQLGRLYAGAADVASGVTYLQAAAWREAIAWEAGDDEVRPARLHWAGHAPDGAARASSAPLAGSAARSVCALDLQPFAVDLAGFAAAHEVAVDAVLLAAWIVVLARLGRLAEARAWWLCDGRGIPELAGVIGPLTEPLPVRAVPGARKPFVDLVREVDEAMREGRRWHPYLDVGALPGPTTCFACEDWTVDWPAGAPRARVRSVRRPDDPHPLAVTVVRSGQGLSAELRSLDEAIPAARLGRELAAALPALIGEPPGPSFQLVVPPGAGDAPALRAGAVSLDRSALVARVERLAKRLQAEGVAPEVPVAVALPRSAELCVAALATLRAGGVYVPLDPGYPPDRVEAMLAESRPAVLVTTAAVARALPASSARLVLVDADAGEAPASARALPSPPPEALAYVMFTSGTTGRPRPVAITRGNLAHYASVLGRELQLGPDGVYLHTASFAFSSSMRQLMVPITAGCELVVADEDEVRDPIRLLRLIQRAGVTVWDVVPSVWRHVVEAVRRLDPAERRALLDNSLRLIVSASEPLRPDLPRAWNHELGHPARVVNMYGQTETCGIVTVFRGAPPDSAAIPVGLPIDGTYAEVLDDALEPVAHGEPGELCIGGLQLGRGYPGDATLTAARFVPDPRGEAGARIYRTGDRARRRADGAIELLGRGDSQVKIRGQRVELADVEAALQADPRVAESAVLACEDPRGELGLVGIVAPRAGCEIDQAVLRGALARRLPRYMVPAQICVIERLPRLPNQKIDRRALLDAARGAGEQPIRVPARTALEQAIAGLFGDVLGRAVGLDDDFVAAGGHSLLAAEVLARTRDLLGIEVPLHEFFHAPTVRTVAVIARRLGIDDEIDDLVAELEAMPDEEVARLTAAAVDAACPPERGSHHAKY